VQLRIRVREQLRALGFDLATQTKMLAAVSAIAQNALQHAGGGDAGLEVLQPGGSVGLQVVVADHGPGIADLQEAMRDGFSTSASGGGGLRGAARLLDAFQVETPPDGGTRVILTMWRRSPEEAAAD